jgi:hypothetical protein
MTGWLVGSWGTSKCSPAAVQALQNRAGTTDARRESWTNAENHLNFLSQHPTTTVFDAQKVHLSDPSAQKKMTFCWTEFDSAVHCPSFRPWRADLRDRRTLPSDASRKANWVERETPWRTRGLCQSQPRLGESSGERQALAEASSSRVCVWCEPEPAKLGSWRDLPVCVAA